MAKPTLDLFTALKTGKNDTDINENLKRLIRVSELILGQEVTPEEAKE
jgi:hypothetical protein